MKQCDQSACIRIDIDDLRTFNNEISHLAGDNVLKTIVTVLRQKVKPRDKIYRVGGDEFAIICQDFTGLEAEGTMQRVASSLKSKVIRGQGRGGQQVEKQITLSIGISDCDNGSKITKAFEFAEQAALESKENGKNRITRFGG